MFVYRGPTGSRVECHRPRALFAGFIFGLSMMRPVLPERMPEACFAPKVQPEPCAAYDYAHVPISTIRVWTYHVGLPSIKDAPAWDFEPMNVVPGPSQCLSDSSVNVDRANPFRVRDRGVASVAFIPLYRVGNQLPRQYRRIGKRQGWLHPKRVGTLRNVVVGEVPNGDGKDYSKEDYLRELRAGQEEVLNARKALEQARCDRNARKVLELEATFPEWPSMVATQYSDGYALSGDPSSEGSVEPPMPIDFLGIDPKAEFVDRKERDYWIGRIYLANVRDHRRCELRIDEALGLAFGLSARKVWECGQFATRCNRSYGRIPGSKSKLALKRFATDAPLEGDWGLRMVDRPYVAWTTCDGERSMGLWTRMGSTDRDYRKWRQRLERLW